MPNKPTLSVITIVRNGMPFVNETIRSVVTQTYSEIEYILVDGGSTDGTLDIIKENDSLLTKWVSESDEGISDAFNKGLSLASGDYLMFLNADDALSNPTVLEDIAEKIVAHKFPTFIYGDCDVLERETDNILYRASIEFSVNDLRRGRMMPHPSLLTSRDYFDKHGGFDVQYKIAMDYEWLLRGGFTERVVHIPMLVTNVRNGGVSAINHTAAVNEIIAALKKNNLISSKWSEIRMRSYFSVRAFLRKLLSIAGLYKVLSAIRNRAVKLSRSRQE